MVVLLFNYQRAAIQGIVINEINVHIFIFLIFETCIVVDLVSPCIWIHSFLKLHIP